MKCNVVCLTVIMYALTQNGNRSKRTKKLSKIKINLKFLFTSTEQQLFRAVTATVTLEL